MEAQTAEAQKKTQEMHDRQLPPAEGSPSTPQISQDDLSDIILPLSRAAVRKVHDKKALDAKARQAVQEERLVQEVLSPVASRMRQLNFVSTQLLNLIIIDEHPEAAAAKRASRDPLTQ